MILSNKNIAIEVSRHGAELFSLSKGGTEYLWNGDPQYWNRHAPILFPVVGKPYNNTLRIDDKEYHMKQHGFARDCDFDYVAESATSCHLFLPTQSMPTSDVYPYHYRLEVLYQLIDNTVDITWAIANCGQRDMHFQIGAHPGFMLPDYHADDPTHGFICFYDADGNPVSPKQTSALDDGNRTPLAAPTIHPSLMPIGTDTFANDALIFEQKQIATAELCDKEGKALLKVECEQADAFGIWAPHKPGCSFVCLEPWCGICDPKGYTGDIADRPYDHPLPPGDVYQFHYAITIL